MIHKTTRSILSVLLAALLLVTSIPLTPAFAGGGGVSPQSANSERGGLEGSGKEGDPYQIATADDLLKFAKLVNDDGKTDASAVLTANIDLSEICGENIGGESVSWTPIGNSIDNPYEGTFNGAGHTISGLYINTDDQGLFGYVSGTVQNLSVSGTVSGGMFVGGIAGQNLGNVINCAFSGSVSGVSFVGGVVGYNGSSGTVKNCYNTGAVSGSGLYVGGVVGNNYNGSVENCYNTGDVSGNNYVGGVVGQNSGSVKNCYNTGTVTGSGDRSNVGGVVGDNIIGTVTGCYFLQQDGLSGGATGAESLTADEFAIQNSFTNSSWDFDNTWEIESIFGRPTLQANAEIGGTANNPYKIFTATQLKNFRDLVNDANGQVKDSDAHAKLMNDIDLKDVCGENVGESGQSVSWAPIGSDSRPYTGTFNGDGHTISGLYIDSSDTNYQGLFGYLSTDGDNKGTVQDLTVSGDISGDWHVGGVVGYNDGGTVTGCIFSDSGTVTGSSYVGGVVGSNNNGSVKNCTNTGSVKGSGSDWYVGGVVGYSSGGSSASASVTNCYNIGKVTGSADSNNVGGVVGQNNGSSTVENCYNTVSGSVSGYWYVGGVVGNNNGGTVKNCYNTGTGTVTGTGDYVGGVVGYNSGSVENCYNIGNVSGNNYVGGVVGDNRGSVENCYNTGAVNNSGSYVGGVVGRNFGGTVTNCYNTGNVSGGSKGGVVGYNTSGGSVTGCYFLQGTAESGIGEKDGSGDATATEKDRATFHSGEVAWLLENGQAEDQTTPVWGQSNLTATTSLPTLVALDKANAQKVYQVTFDYGTSFADNDERFAYSYTNGVVSEPTKNPELAGHTLSGWYSDPSLTTEWTFDTEISNDKTLYAQWTPVATPDPDPDPEPTPEPEPEEPPYTGKYSYEVFTSVGDNGTVTVDRYATEGEKVTIDVTPDQAYKLDELVVTANGKDVELTANSDGTYTFTMPSADVRISASFAEDPDWTPDEPEEPTTDVSDLFIDIAPDAWYKDAVQYAYDNGLMTGVSATEFAPEQTTTRAMIVSILARLEGVTTAQAAGFADVNDEWYATAVNWAANVGVVNGYEDNTFQPNTAITREQLAAILMNYAAYKGEDVSNRADLTSYTDQPSTWAQEAMQWAVAEGLISGVTNDQLQPQGNATRAQVAAILQRFLTK